MSSNVKISISPEELIRAIKEMKKGERGIFGRSPCCYLSRIFGKH